MEQRIKGQWFDTLFSDSFCPLKASQKAPKSLLKRLAKGHLLKSTILKPLSSEMLVFRSSGGLVKQGFSLLKRSSQGGPLKKASSQGFFASAES